MPNSKNNKKKKKNVTRRSPGNVKKPGLTKKQAASHSKGKNNVKQAGKKQQSVKKNAVNAKTVNSTVQGNIITVLSFVASLFFFFFTIVEGENIWFDIHSFILGIFGDLSIIWALFFLYASAKFANKSNNGKNAKIFFRIFWGLFFLSTFWYIFFKSPMYHDGTPKPSYFDILSASYRDGSHGSGACVTSALLGELLCIAFGVIGAKITILIIIFYFIISLCGYRIDFVDRGRQAVVKYLKGEWKVIVGIFKKHKAEKTEKAEKEKNTVEINESTPQNNKRNYAFEQFEKATEGEYDSFDDEYSEFDFSADDSEIAKIMSGAVSYSADTSRQSIMDFLGIDALDDENESAYDNEEESFELDEIFDRRDTLRKQKEEENKEQTEKESDISENNGELSDEEEEYVEDEDDCYRFPPISLLSMPSDDSGTGITPELRANGELLVQTLKSFGVSTRIVNISRGPAVTRYELQPSAGVKVSKITSLADDIALNLSAVAVRIEAPIPGKPAVGIEIPNKEVSIVTLREIIDTNEFNASKSKLTVALGKDINGDCAFADLAKMPHLLIAGTTGSGKSVCINSIIASILYKASPDEVKLLMIDPKMVELGVYNGIPHLLVPVVTDAKKAAGALGWAVTEMMRRYNTFAENNVRDIFGYNKLAEKGEMRKMEQIVIIIDELADLMMVAAKEVEDSIHRLAQMARAAGMYLIIATQRPSVDTITGVIKANIPSRIAFAVSSPVDSRTILDSSGAEKLIGRGDMLFVPIGATKPKRIQGCFISDNEIEHIAEYIKNSHIAEYDDDISSEIDRQAELAVKSKKGKGSDDDGESFDFEDEALMQAIEFVIDAGQASTSMLQRRLRVGYARAGRLIDEMENMGIVGPHEGSKPRSVLMTKAQFLEMKMRKKDDSDYTEE